MDFAKLLVDRFSQRSIKDKLKLLAYAAALGVVILTVIFLFSEKRLLLEERQNSVRQAVETATGIVEHYHGLSRQGAFSEDEAKRSALKAISALRYSGQEYFWVNDLDVKMLMHPIKPELDGTDVAGDQRPRWEASVCRVCQNRQNERRRLRVLYVAQTRPIDSG